MAFAKTQKVAKNRIKVKRELRGLGLRSPQNFRIDEPLAKLKLRLKIARRRKASGK